MEGKLFALRLSLRYHFKRHTERQLTPAFFLQAPFLMASS